MTTNVAQNNARVHVPTNVNWLFHMWTGAGTGGSAMFLLAVSIYHQYSAILHYSHSSVVWIAVCMAIAVDIGWVHCEMSLWLLDIRNEVLRSLNQPTVSAKPSWCYLVVATCFSIAMNYWGFTQGATPWTQDWYVSSGFALFMPIGIAFLSKVATQQLSQAVRVKAEDRESAAERQADRAQARTPSVQTVAVPTTSAEAANVSPKGSPVTPNLQTRQQVRDQWSRDQQNNQNGPRRQEQRGGQKPVQGKDASPQPKTGGTPKTATATA